MEFPTPAGRPRAESGAPRSPAPLANALRAGLAQLQFDVRTREYFPILLGEIFESRTFETLQPSTAVRE
jgi:hypothetical protein